MIKTLLPAALLLIGLGACKKSYNCQCQTVLTYKAGPDSLASSTYPGAIYAYDEKMKKEQADAACASEAAVIKNSFTKWYTHNDTIPLKEGESIQTNCSIQ
jgi:hypothetical protein